MDDQGNIYMVSDEPVRKRLREDLQLAMPRITTQQAQDMKLKPITRPLSRAERKSMKIGRNSPCGCGSGLKFKRCCYGK